MKRLTSIFLLFFIFISGCSTNSANVTKAYLNRQYNLIRAGDLHGLSPNSSEVLDEKHNKGFTSYIHLFDKSKSFVNFQCKGTSYDNFYCDGTLVLYDLKGNLIMEAEEFRCSYSDGQWGSIIYENQEMYSKLGIIYVYTPYWCRCQFYYDISGDGNLTLLTFEFWVAKGNDLPSFVSGG